MLPGSIEWLLDWNSGLGKDVYPLNDLRLGFRQLFRNKAFGAVLVLTVAVGIGVNAAVFSAAHAVVLQPLPYKDPSRLVAIFGNHPGLPPGYRIWGVSASEIDTLRSRSKTLSQIVGYDTEFKFAFSRRLTAALVGSDFFPFLGVRPLYGRTFVPDDTQGAGDSTVIIGYKLWQEAFNSNPNAIGSTILVDEKRYAVVGIMPASFDFPEGAELWLPLPQGQFSDDDPEYEAVGKLSPGGSLSQVHAELATITVRSPGAGKRGKEHNFDAVALKDKLIPSRYQDPLLILLGATTFVLLIACVNVATLSLSRGFARRPEFLMRRALGATRWRLIRQVIAESLAVALAGGVCSISLAYWGVAVLRADLPPDTPRIADVHADASLLLFTLLASLAAGLLFGTLPAVLLTRAEIGERWGATLSTVPMVERSRRSRDALVMGQVAIAFVLIAAATLALGGLRRMLAIPLGFQGDRVLTMSVLFPARRFSGPGEYALLTREMLDALRPMQGLRGVAAAVHVPMVSGLNRTRFEIEGSVSGVAAQRARVDKNWITPGFFSVLGVPLLAGRDFSEQDHMGSVPVAIVSAAFARKYLDGRSAVGVRIGVDISPGDPIVWREVVGEVGDIRDLDPEVVPVPTIYLPVYQVPTNFGAVGVLIRTTGEPAKFAGPLRSSIARLDAGGVFINVGTMNEWVKDLDAGPRSRTELLGIFATLSLLLAFLGVFGTLSYSVAQRSREISIRMALGATSSCVLRLIVREVMTVTGAGILGGLAGTLALGRSIRALFWGINPNSPFTLITVAAILGCVSLLACLAPALGAARIEPMVELRHE